MDKGRVAFGYVTPKKFGPYFIPVPIQNQLLRRRSSELGLPYGLGVGELIFEGSYSGLIATIANADRDSLVLMCSWLQLPPPGSGTLQHVEAMMRKKNISIWSEFEKLTFDSGSSLAQKLREIRFQFGLGKRRGV